jgi:hypothetical protein
MNLLTSAKNYTNKGLSVISTDNNKRSIAAWKPYQSHIATDQELEQMFAHPKTKGLAVICGAVSGNLEVIDVDCKYGIEFQKYADLIKMESMLLWDKLLIITTKSNGFHIYYRCEYIEGNQKLANRPANDDELNNNPNIKELVLIETRGEGGYVIAPPTDGYNHLQGTEINVITAAEREILMTCARSFNLIPEQFEQPHVEFETSGLTVWEDYNNRGNCVELLESHGWQKVFTKDNKIHFRRPGATSLTSANYHTEKKIFYVFTTSSQFQPKGYAPFGVYAILECNGDFKKATKQLAEKGYGDKKKQGDEDNWFWFTNQKGGITIQKYKLEKWLSHRGFGLYFHDPKSHTFRLIREQDKKICEVSTEYIKKFIREAVEAEKWSNKPKENERQIENILEVIYRQAESLFSSSFFEFFTRRNIDILKDNWDAAFFPFKNGIVAIDGDKCALLPYSTFDKHIWENQIINFNISLDEDFDASLCKYYEFIRKISNEEMPRINYAITLIGYILHSYKDPSKPFAPILAEETDDESKGGGTGKGIFFKAISKMIPTVSIDGKNFKPDKTFAFQRVSLGTKLVVIEDCPRNVEFERYYPTITEGITIEKKNKDELFLNYNESPKIAFTTNYSISNTAEHAKRRQKVFEFSSFFSSKYTPVDHFKEKLFDDWDEDEWNRFYNFMFICVSGYLKHGIQSVDNSDKLKKKQIKLQFGEEFLDYFNDAMTSKMEKYYVVADEWKSFLMVNEFDKKDYSFKRFKKALEISAKIFEMGYIDYKNRQNNNVKEFKLTKSEATDYKIYE